jgi:hypothetical protein
MLFDDPSGLRHSPRVVGFMQVGRANGAAGAAQLRDLAHYRPLHQVANLLLGRLAAVAARGQLVAVVVPGDGAA